MAAIRTSDWSAQTEASLGKIQAVADRASHAVEGGPAHIFLTNASLQHQVFDEASNWIVREGRDNRRVHAETAPKPASHVVFASTFPRAKMARRGDAPIAGIEAEHDFAETHQVPHTSGF